MFLFFIKDFKIQNYYMKIIIFFVFAVELIFIIYRIHLSSHVEYLSSQVLYLNSFNFLVLMKFFKLILCFVRAFNVFNIDELTSYLAATTFFSTQSTHSQVSSYI